MSVSEQGWNKNRTEGKREREREMLSTTSIGYNAPVFLRVNNGDLKEGCNSV